MKQVEAQCRLECRWDLHPFPDIEARWEAVPISTTLECRLQYFRDQHKVTKIGEEVSNRPSPSAVPAPHICGVVVG
jgi:hypothetical protein